MRPYGLVGRGRFLVLRNRSSLSGGLPLVLFTRRDQEVMVGWLSATEGSP